MLISKLFVLLIIKVSGINLKRALFVSEILEIRSRTSNARVPCVSKKWTLGGFVVTFSSISLPVTAASTLTHAESDTTPTRWMLTLRV